MHQIWITNNFVSTSIKRETYKSMVVYKPMRVIMKGGIGRESRKTKSGEFWDVLSPCGLQSPKEGYWLVKGQQRIKGDSNRNSLDEQDRNGAKWHDTLVE